MTRYEAVMDYLLAFDGDADSLCVNYLRDLKVSHDAVVEALQKAEMTLDYAAVYLQYEKESLGAITWAETVAAIHAALKAAEALR